MKKDNHLIIGKIGEDLANDFLIKNHYQILKRNYSKKWGEIDIVALDSKTKEIVFVEVKSRLVKLKENSSPLVLPEEELTERKIQKLQKAILSFLAQYRLEDFKWRFDLIAVEIYSSNNFQIRHYKSIYLEF